VSEQLRGLRHLAAFLHKIEPATSVSTKEFSPTSISTTTTATFTMFARSAVRALSTNSRTFTSSAARQTKVAVLGAGGGIGQPLSLLLKSDTLVTSLSLYDIRGAPGVAADVSHVDTPSEVCRFRYLSPL
jgi:hypothetical protein